MYPAAAAAAVTTFLLLLPLLLFLLLSEARRRGRPRPPPPLHGRHALLPPSPPGATLPILGHLHLVSARRPHVSLRDLVRRHGSEGLLLLRLGQVPTLVVSSPRAAEAVLRARDRAFASRPPSAAAAVLFSGPSNVSLAPYGERWRQARRLVTTHLLSARKVRSFRRAREEEARLLVHRIAETCSRDNTTTSSASTVVDLSDLLGAYVNDVVCRAVSGTRRDEARNRTFRELSSRNAAVLGGFNLDDLFPSLLAANKLVSGVVCAKARRLKKGWDRLLDSIIDEHAAVAKPPPPCSSSSSSRREDDGDDEQQQQLDFVDVLLSLQQEYGLTREQVKAILTDMFAAGTDTSSIVLDYAMVELVRNPEVMARLRAEIISNTPRREQDDDDMVKEEDLDAMVYLKAVVKETLRLHPPVPLLLPRLCMEECEVVVDDGGGGGGGYTVPAGTRVIVNAWALGRDTESWKERPEEFVPERFLDDDNLRSFVPFGGGRRMCPGMSFGMATVEIMLANLVYRFHWELPAAADGTKKKEEEEEDMDMTEVFGLTMRRRQNLHLVPSQGR